MQLEGALTPIAGDLEEQRVGGAIPRLRAEGYEARLELDRLAEGRKRFKGVLAGVEDDAVAIDLEGEEATALVPFAWITEAKLVLTDKLLERGAQARAQRLTSNSDQQTSQ